MPDEQGLPTRQEQWERFERDRAWFEAEREKYRRGERADMPPRPVPPHTPGLMPSADPWPPE